MKRYLDRNRRLADYIYNDMNPEEMVRLENEIQHDPVLSDSYQLNRQVRDYLQAKIQLEEMRSDPQLEDAERLAEMAFNSGSPAEKVQYVPSRKKKKIRYVGFAAAIAASVILIISLGIFPFGQDQDQLFAQYYAPIAASDYSQRGVAQEVYEDIDLGIAYYLEGNYNQAIDRLAGLASDQVVQAEVNFFTGLSYLGQGEFQLALSNLEKNLLGSDLRYQAETMWYLSLCYLKTGEIAKASILLGQLEMYEGMYKQDAQTLRKKLRRLK